MWEMWIGGGEIEYDDCWKGLRIIIIGDVGDAEIGYWELLEIDTAGGESVEGRICGWEMLGDSVDRVRLLIL